MLIISGITAAFLVLLGIVFSCGKGSSLIAGYNTASPEEKVQYNEKALCRAMGGMMFALAACCIVMGLSEIFQTMAFFWIGFVLLFIVVIGGVIYMNTAQKVKRK